MVDSKSKKRLLVVTVILLVGIGFMIYQSTGSSISYVEPIDKVVSDPSYIGKNVNVGGTVLKGYVTQGSKHTFTIADKGKQLTVEYTGQLPSTFGSDVKVVADGKLVSKDKLVAKSITTKCPSKYESEEKKKTGGK